MDKLSDLIKARLERHNLSASAKSAEVLHKANILLSEVFGKQKIGLKAYRLDNGNLYIAAENSVWSQELWGIQKSILDSLKKNFGERVVNHIKIKSLTIE
jgi:hypothetical protein